MFVLFQPRFLSSRTFGEERFAEPSNKSREIDGSESKDRESRGRNRWKRIRSWWKRSIERRGELESERESTFAPAISSLINCGEDAPNGRASTISRNLHGIWRFSEFDWKSMAFDRSICVVTYNEIAVSQTSRESNGTVLRDLQRVFIPFND